MGFCTIYNGGGTCDTGRENTQLLDGHASTFPAAEYCADSTAHGRSDWYLPAVIEMFALYDNLKAGDPTGPHNLQNAIYWSSSEYNNSAAWQQDFTNGLDAPGGDKDSNA